MQDAEGQSGPIPVDRTFQLLHNGQAKIIGAITLTVANRCAGQTQLASGQIWASGTFEGFITPKRTQLHDSLIVIPTDRRAIRSRHRRGAVVAQDVYTVSMDFVMGHLDRIAALDLLLKSPEHSLREEHIMQILNSLENIAENDVVSI